MINYFNKQFDLKKYKNSINSSTNISKVSFYCKNNFEEILNGRLLILDFEFSMNKHIYEIGGFIIDNKKITEHIFKEYSLPNKEPVWDFNLKRFVVQNININKPIFNDSEWLFNLISNVDYVVVHNYVAESGCLFKLKYPNQKYESSRCEFVQSKKFICTSYSFKNKFFKSLGLTEGSNSKISEFFEWRVTEENDKIILLNDGIRMVINKPPEVVGKLHNAFYDSAITLTNLLSLHLIANKTN